MKVIFLIDKKTKLAVHNKVNHAIKTGKLKKQPCIYCGSICVIAHHEDYTKPFNVIWMCRKHHSKYHYNKLDKQLITVMKITYKWLYIDKDVTYDYLTENKLCQFVKM